MHTPESLMRLAIEKCREGLAAGQSPFGCAIARGDELLAVAHNTVVLATDITAHAEMNAVRQGCERTGGIFLEDATVASTCEPCAMCMAALHWARVRTVYFGASIEDAQLAGFNELQLPAAEVLRLGESQVRLVPGILPSECQTLFTEWAQNPARRPY